MSEINVPRKTQSFPLREGRVQERSAWLRGRHCRGSSGMVVSREAQQPHKETQAAKEDRVSPWLGLRPHDFSSGCLEGHAPHASQGPEVGPWAGAGAVGSGLPHVHRRQVPHAPRRSPSSLPPVRPVRLLFALSISSFSPFKIHPKYVS